MKNRKAEVDNFVCLNCRNRFIVDTYDYETYGIWHLRCNRCGQKAIVNTSKDMIWEKTLEQVNEKYPTYSDKNSHDDNHPRTIELEKRFEATCDPCSCGGRFEVRAKPRCPKCFATNLKELPPSILDEDLVPDNRIRITHTQWEKEHAKQT